MEAVLRQVIDLICQYIEGTSRAQSSCELYGLSSSGESVLDDIAKLVEGPEDQEFVWESCVTDSALTPEVRLLAIRKAVRRKPALLKEYGAIQMWVLVDIRRLARSSAPALCEKRGFFRVYGL